jgi:Glycosyl hydrolases family 2, TIM barrel domain.
LKMYCWSRAWTWMPSAWVIILPIPKF